MADVARELISLPTRPPTPPRESSATKQACTTSEDTKILIASNRRSAVDTPDLSPSSSAENAHSSSRRAQKRVGFSPWTEYHKAPLTSSKKPNEHHLKHLPPSRECRPSNSRSILKPFDCSVPTKPSGGLSTHSYGSFATMLESVVQQLAGEVRSSRIDAYISLSGTLKAYDGVPDPRAMADKMRLLIQFIRRDMCATMPGTGTMDTALITQALKLLTIFIWTPELSDPFSDDFQSFTLDRAIYVLEEPQIPKAIINHYMHLLATQKFKSRIMSTERANRLITCLDNIQDRVNGNGIIGSRLAVYQRLLEQVRSVMVLRISDWIDHVFSGMLSTIKPIRSRAIAFGIDAGLAMGTTSTVTRAVMDVFNRSGEDDRTFADFMCDRLNKMVTLKDDGAHVPQIWSVPVLFLRSRRHQLEHWEHMKAWLYIIQRCFNSSDILVKFQANVAWNRLVFAINPDTATGHAMMKMLRQPIISQLDRKASDKQSKQARQVAFGSYCNLLYYALKPSATHQQLDVYWTQYVSQVFSNAFLSSKADLCMGSQILASLLGDAQLRPWNENRANEIGPIKPEELPRIDPRWVRSRVSSVIPVFERVFRAANWPDTPDHAAQVKQAWQSFMRALGEAGSKEVKVSTECMEAVAETFNMLQRIWKTGPSSLGVDLNVDSQAFVEGFGFLLEMAIDYLGPLPFTEKLLLRSSKDSFHASVTPSHTSSRSNRLQKSPIMHLLDFLLRPQDNLRITESYDRVVRNLLQKAVCSRTSRGARLELLRQWTQGFAPDLVSGSSTLALSCIWDAFAVLTKSCLTTLPSHDCTSDSPRYPGHEYRDVVKILEVGLKQGRPKTSEIWEELCRSLMQVVKRERGDGALILAVLEPLANLPELKDAKPSQDLAVNCASLLLENTVWPPNGQAMGQARKALWGVAPTSRKSADFDPFDHTCEMVNSFLAATYQDLDALRIFSIRRFLGAILILLQRVPLPFLAILLKRIQNDLAKWIRDGDHKFSLTRNNSPQLRSNVCYITSAILLKLLTVRKVTKLWSAITAAIETLPNKDSSMLQHLEPLIVSGFESRQKAIVNETVKFWNRTFGCEENLEYPESVRHRLHKLRSIAVLRLPSFPDISEDQIDTTPFNFSDSQDECFDEDLDAAQPVATSCEARGRLGPSFIANSPESSPLRPALHHKTQSPQSSIEPTHSKTTPTPRPRHDDSQVQFAAIESSPFSETFPESQLLTDRQREVKERQQTQPAAMFPDLRSSPGPKSREMKDGLPRLSLSSDRAATGELVADGPTTPTLPPPQNGLMDDFVASSPTYRSSTKRRGLESDDIGPPSSPPDFKAVVAVYQLADPPSSPPSNCIGNDISSQKPDDRPKPSKERMMEDHNAEFELPEYIPRVFEHAEVPASAKDGIIETERVTRTAANAIPSILDHHPLSDVDVFVDALPSPIPSSQIEPEDALVNDPDNAPVYMESNKTEVESCPNECINPHLIMDGPLRDAEEVFSSFEDNVSRVINSFGNDRTEQSPSNEGQVSLQLGKDLSKAAENSSIWEQDDHEFDVVARVTPQDTKKRKRPITGTFPRMKKAKTSSPRRNIQVVIEVQRHSSPEVADDLLDCIVVDSRPATARANTSLSEVKAEQTPSPFKSTQAPASTPVDKRRPGRPRKGESKLALPISKDLMPPRSKKRRASDSAIHHGESGPVLMTTPPITKKRRSSRLSQTSVSSPSQRDPNRDLLQNDCEATKKSDPFAPVGGPEAAGGEVSPLKAGDYGPSDCADAGDMQGSKFMSARTEFPSAGKKDSPGMRDYRAEHGQTIGSADGSVRTDCANRDSVAVGEADQVVEGVDSTSQQEKGVQEASIAKGDLHPGADTVKPSGDRLEVKDQSAQTDSTQRTSQAEPINGRGILGGLKRILKDIQQVMLGSQEEREIDDVLFDIRKEVHEAGRRGVS
ncbi:MAG: hypothetical protein M1830_008375 [Pleopsidium flavum]|nr:MAG: hypothetical protein M1830_008375 [Pleopsidium flavum]